MGVSTHNIGLMYFGNLLCGIGYGAAYTPPIQACLDWFPDRKGLASGIVIAGFGSGALFFTPMMGYLSSKFATMPTFLGNNLDVITGRDEKKSILLRIFIKGAELNLRPLNN